MLTWPVGAKADSKIDLTPEKETVWKKWVDIYREKMLSSGIIRTCSTWWWRLPRAGRAVTISSRVDWW